MSSNAIQQTTSELSGAEAVLVAGTYLGRPILEKRRLPKRYRHPELDARLRDERTRDEGNLLLAARRAGVSVPIVYDIDRTAAVLRLEKVSGQTLHHALDHMDGGARTDVLHTLGAMIARLHAGGVTHGDLTPANVMVRPGGGLVLIDFGLGHATQEVEPKGVDLHLLEEALDATRSGASGLFEAFLDGYRSIAQDAEPALRRLEDIRERGRYRNA